MKADAQYKMTKYFNLYAVAAITPIVNEDNTITSYVEKYASPIECRDRVWALNGWGEAKYTPAWMIAEDKRIKERRIYLEERFQRMKNGYLR